LFGLKKLETSLYRVMQMHFDILNRLGECDGRADRQTDRRTDVRTELSWATSPSNDAR